MTRSIRLSFVAGLVATTALVVAGCASGAATSAPASGGTESAAAGGPCTPSTEIGTVAVDISGFAFPAEVEAEAGETISWTNNDAAQHTVTLDDGSCTTPQFSTDATGSLTFTQAGTYAYHCNVHPNMTGRIVIAE
jgi:plastocyanin